MYVHVCTGAHGGRKSGEHDYFFTANNIHILSSIELQYCRHPSLLLGKKLIYSPAGMLVGRE